MTGDSDAKGGALARMPILLKFLGLHLVIGAALGVAFASIITSSNAVGLAELIDNSAQPTLARVMLYVMNALTFGSLAMGLGVMMLPMDTPCDMREKDKQNDD